jgi:Geranylgeranyl pyrophosphate synthase
MLSIEQILNKVEEEISKIRFDLSPQTLFKPIEYTLDLGGKRIRPSMTLLACNIYNKDIVDAIKPAMGLEIFHNFTLLHDDLMDQADKRRNKPTVHKKWNTNTAILSGDAMVIASYQLMGETPEPFLKRILRLFSQTALEICCGQQYDMDFEELDNVTEDQYMEMIRLKTAVLIACGLKTGAIIGGAPEKDAEILYRFGKYIGLSFQLQDDLLDVYGDSATFGKNIGGDILCDKKTFLLINAINNANEKQKTIMDFYGNPANIFSPAEKIQAYTEIYNQLNIKEITQEKINTLYKHAMNELTYLEVETEQLSELKKFSNMLMLRES